MKEAIGTSFVFNMMMVFVGVMIALLVGSLAYSKGFKIRNRIIDIVQKYEGYNDYAKEEIDKNLADIGYKLSKNNKCRERNGVTATQDSDYRYCIYRYDTSKGPYYGVTVFITIDIPIIGDFVEIPLYGETRILFEKDKVTG